MPQQVIQSAEQVYYYRQLIFSTPIGGTNVWTNMPAADTPLASALLDLRGVTQARLYGAFGSVAAFSPGLTHLHAQFSTNSGTAWNELAPVPVIAGKLMWTVSTNGQSGWFAVATGSAAEDAWIRIMGTGGNGTVDPTYLGIGMEFR